MKFNLKIKSISFKFTLLYFFLAFLYMPFFLPLIFEHQNDIISDNNRLNIEKDAFIIINTINNIPKDKIQALKKDDVVATTTFLIKYITNILTAINKPNANYAIFSEDGTVHYRSAQDIKITDTDIRFGITAVTNREFTGKQYYFHVDEKNHTVSFYIPLKLNFTNTPILYFNFKILSLNKALNTLYKIAFLMILFSSLFHGFFGILIYRLLIKPIKRLSKQTKAIQDGNYSARIKVKQDDEIGLLGKSFNSMASSIQENITQLRRFNDRMNLELLIANDVQKAILPNLTETERFKFACDYFAYSKVSGDYFDVFQLDENRWGLLIIDVSGHGVPAALITMVAKEKFKTLAPHYDSPSELMVQVNNELCELLQGRDTYFSAAYLVIDENNVAKYCRAGHLEPILIKPASKKISLLNTSGFLVGVSPGMNHLYETKEIQLDKGDKIILYTDGIVEANNSEGEEFSKKKLLQLLIKSYNRPIDEIKENVISQLKAYAGDVDFKDDYTLFITEIK